MRLNETTCDCRRDDNNNESDDNFAVESYGKKFQQLFDVFFDLRLGVCSEFSNDSIYYVVLLVLLVVVQIIVEESK